MFVLFTMSNIYMNTEYFLVCILKVYRSMVTLSHHDQVQVPLNISNKL